MGIETHNLPDSMHSRVDALDHLATLHTDVNVCFLRVVSTKFECCLLWDSNYGPFGRVIFIETDALDHLANLSALKPEALFVLVIMLRT